jgi:hypothetical protein
MVALACQTRKGNGGGRELVSRWLTGLTRKTLVLAAALTLAACGPSEPEVAGGAPDLRRLTEAQYRNIVADVFGRGIEVGGRFDPLVRTDGLLAVGARNAPITPSGFEQLEQMARSIAAQVVSPRNRGLFVGCAPAVPSTFDDACATLFLARTGRALFRRPLAKDELDLRLAAAKVATESLGDFHRGLAAALSSMMVAPQFLYVIDTTEPDPDNAGAVRLDGFAKAARLSFLLWNTTPDDALLAAAERGELHTAKGLGREVERLLASPRARDGVNAFFADMLAFDGFETLEKDSVIYPAFSLAVAEDAREQTLRTVTDVLLYKNADYRSLFTTRATFMSGALARLYRVHMPKTDRWAPYDFETGSAYAGIQSHISFTALHAHPGRSSPTLRGKAIRELLLCQKIPDPPGDVDFSVFTDPGSPIKTARERLTAHQTAPACVGCHKLTDPIGLSLEEFDGSGQFRDNEQGAPIITSGELDGAPFTDAADLGRALSANPASVSCVVNRLYAYAVGRSPAAGDSRMLTFLQENFADGGYRFPALLNRLATSEALFAVSGAAKAGEAGLASRDPRPDQENRS